MVTTPRQQISFAEYLNYDDGTDNRYELVNGELVLMPPATARHSDIIEFIVDCFKAIIRSYSLDIRVKAGDVGIQTGINSSRIPDISVIQGEVWRNLPRDTSAVVKVPLLLAVEVVSPGSEQIERDYVEKVAEYADAGILEYWIVDPMEKKVTILVLENGGYNKNVFNGDDAIACVTFPQLQVTTSDILSV